MKFSLESLRRANAATQENERIILNFDTDLQKTIATLEQSERFKRADRATQDALNRRAALDFVTESNEQDAVVDQVSRGANCNQ